MSLAFKTTKTSLDELQLTTSEGTVELADFGNAIHVPVDLTDTRVEIEIKGTALDGTKLKCDVQGHIFRVTHGQRPGFRHPGSLGVDLKFSVSFPLSCDDPFNAFAFLVAVEDENSTLLGAWDPLVILTPKKGSC